MDENIGGVAVQPAVGCRCENITGSRCGVPTPVVTVDTAAWQVALKEATELFLEVLWFVGLAADSPYQAKLFESILRLKIRSQDITDCFTAVKLGIRSGRMQDMSLQNDVLRLWGTDHFLIPLNEVDPVTHQPWWSAQERQRLDQVLSALGEVHNGLGTVVAFEKVVKKMDGKRWEYRHPREAFINMIEATGWRSQADANFNHVIGWTQYHYPAVAVKAEHALMAAESTAHSKEIEMEADKRKKGR